MKQIGQLQAKQ